MRRSMTRLSVFLLTALSLAALALASCASAGDAAPPKGPTEKVYEGAGRDESLLSAMNKAKMDAVRKAVVEMLGAAEERANRQTLERTVYNTKNPNAFVVNETLKVLRK